MPVVFIEAVEPRAFLSASPDDLSARLAADQQRVGADLQQLAVNLQHCGEALAGPLQALGADLERLAATAEGQALADRLTADLAHHGRVLGDNVNAVIAAGAPAGGAIVDDVVQLFLHRDDPEQVRARRAKLAADLRQLRSDTAPALADLRRDLSAAARVLSKDLRAIARFLDNDPAFRQHRQSLTTHLADCSRTIRADLKTLAADVQTLLRNQARSDASLVAVRGVSAGL